MAEPSPTLRPLGETGLVVSRIGLGLAALGRPAYINLGRDIGPDRSIEALERRTHEVLDAAYAAGVRYVDAARSYGEAEVFLADWLESRHIHEMAVGSKWGYRYVGDWRMDARVHEVKDHSLVALEEQFAVSRRILGLNLDLYQIHSATLESGVLEDRAVLGRLAALREEGLVVGLSVSGPQQAKTVRAALDVDIDGVNPFSCVQATWNLLERSVGPVLEEASRRGWGVIVKEALANGRLVAGVEGGPLAALTESHHATPDAVAIAAALNQPWADVVLSGAASSGHLRSNLGALALSVDADEWAALDVLTEEPEEYWARRSGLDWL